jgi:hypothetical protein
MATNNAPKIQIDDVVRPMNSEELAQFETQRAEDAARIAAGEAKVAARASALAKLAELGLTQEEIAAL